MSYLFFIICIYILQHVAKIETRSPGEWGWNRRLGEDQGSSVTVDGFVAGGCLYYVTCTTAVE
jgi:hypothetical protein